MLGDFWGAVKEDPFRNRNGVSVIFVRTGKGRNLLRNTEGIRLFLSDFERAAVENSMVVHSRKERPEKENIRFWGWQENPYPYIAAADWFVSASEYETFGLSVHEAGALNVPSIVGTLPVFEECVDREKVLLVENGEEGIYQGMLYAVRQSRLSQGMKKRNDDKLHEEQYIKRLKAIEDLIIG